MCFDCSLPFHGLCHADRQKRSPKSALWHLLLRSRVGELRSNISGTPILSPTHGSVMPCISSRAEGKPTADGSSNAPTTSRSLFRAVSSSPAHHHRARKAPPVVVATERLHLTAPWSDPAGTVDRLRPWAAVVGAQPLPPRKQSRCSLSRRRGELAELQQAACRAAERFQRARHESAARPDQAGNWQPHNRRSGGCSN
jgi:hypothetical protein